MRCLSEKGTHGTLTTAFANPGFSVLMLFNIIGAIAYLTISSCTWTEPELANYPGASGGAGIIWFFTAFPIVAGFGVRDFFWVAFEFFAYLETKKWSRGLAFLPVPAIWVVATWIDFSHH